MAKTEKTKPRKRGRPTKFDEPRVSLSFRLRRPLYEDIKEVAEVTGLSISEEIERRLVQFAYWENRYGEAQRMVDIAREAIQMDLDKALRDNGFKRVSTGYGYAYLDERVPVDLIDGTADADAIMEKVAPTLRHVIGEALLGTRLRSKRGK